MTTDLHSKNSCFLSKTAFHFEPQDALPGSECFVSDGEFLIGLGCTIAQLTSAYDSGDEEATFQHFLSIERSRHYESASAFPIIRLLLELCLLHCC
jgi:hypothetical protein